MAWRGLDGWRAEVSRLELEPGGVLASGTQIGVEPLPYRLDYRLEAPTRFVTRRLHVETAGEGWWRRIDLRHDGRGGWSCDASAEGDTDMGAPGGAVGSLEGALDCDLGLSPLTNLMPVRRHGLHEREGAFEFVMAWVSVPDLGLHPSSQRYEHVSRQETGSVVRYVGAHRHYVGELELDADGLVLLYPELAVRVRAGEGPTPR